MRSSSHFQFAISLPTLLCSGGDSEWHFVCALPVHNLCKYPQRGERALALTPTPTLAVIVIVIVIGLENRSVEIAIALIEHEHRLVGGRN